MQAFDYLIVGGSAAGTTAAETIRNLKPDSTIAIVTDEDHAMYSRVLLPHYIRGKVQREQLFLRKNDFYSEKKIELMKGVRAEGLEASKKTVELSNGKEIKYGKLLIAQGGDVIPLKISGADSKNVNYMRTIEDADAIIKAAKDAKKAVVIGGGFIGLEFCSCFKVNGVSEITLLVREDYYWSGKLDRDSAKVLSNILEKNGIKIETNEEAEKIESGQVVAKSGKKFGADVIGVGIGIKSDFSWLEGSGVVIDKAIVANEYLETSVKDVYVAGDCAQFYDVIFERDHIMGNWANATSQGSVVGKMMAGEKTVFETASSYSINFFDAACSFIGVTDNDFADEVVSRGSVRDNKMTRIFVKKIGRKVRIVGATAINSVADVAPLTSAVKGKIDVSRFNDKLGDSSFDLNKINT